MIVVIPCGGKKRDYPCPAGEMYIGGYHLLCQKYALSLVGGDTSRVYILSALYGLLGFWETIAPYDLRMGRPGSVLPRVVLEQAKLLGIATETEVTGLGGIDYIKMMRRVWPNLKTPLDGVGGIGKHMGWLKAHTRR
jgi:hypothetical protein